MTLHQQLDDFIRAFPLDEVVADISRQTNEKSAEEIRFWVSIYLNESRAALRFIEPYLGRGLKILEIGSGLCVLSLFLKQRGYDITAEEPVQGGFDLFEISRDAITSRHQAIGLEVIPLPSAELDPEQHGRFDLIYSYNVVEHIDRLEASLDAMVNLLTDDGVMVHNCPNYFFPYEPHLALPVVKPIKELSERLFKAKIDQKRALWDSLNFVTYGEIRRFARRGQLDVRFAPGLLHAAFARLEDDPLFRQRHGQSVVGRVFRLLSKTRTLSLLKHLPAAVVSPMQFEISRAPSRDPGRA